MAKTDVEIHKRAMRTYAEEHDIDPNQTPKKLQGAILEAIEEKLADREEEDKYVCPQCERYILDDDVYCWFCGADCSADDSGSFDDRYPEDEEKPIKKKKKKASKKEPEEEPEEEEPEEEEPEEEEPEEEEPEEEEPEEESEEEEPEEESEEEVEDLSLEQRTERILRHARTTGAGGWDMGAELSIIFKRKQWQEGKFANVAEYCEKAIGMTKATAYNYARIADNFTRDQAAQLEIGKLLLLARVKDEKQRTRLLKAALPKQDGGKGMDADTLREKVKTERKKAGVDDKRGRPKLGWSKFTGNTFRGKYTDDDHTSALVHDPEVMGENAAMEIKLLKTGVRVDIVPLAGE